MVGVVSFGIAVAVTGGAIIACAEPLAQATLLATVAPSASGATTTTVAAGIMSTPAGWMILGAEITTQSSSSLQSPSTPTYTFDCWKPVLHDLSSEPSNGRLLAEVMKDSRIKQVIQSQKENSDIPEIVLENIWNEKFRIEYVILSSNEVAAHAIRI